MLGGRGCLHSSVMSSLCRSVFRDELRERNACSKDTPSTGEESTFKFKVLQGPFVAQNIVKILPRGKIGDDGTVHSLTILNFSRWTYILHDVHASNINLVSVLA